MEKVTNAISAILTWICVIISIGLVVIVALQVSTRLLGISLAWTEELARFCLIWLTFLGCSLAIKNHSHLSVNFFVNMASDKVRLIIGVVIYGIMAVFFALIVFYGAKLSSLSINTPSSTMQWPMGMVYSVLPISSAISIYFILLELVDFVKAGGKKL